MSRRRGRGARFNKAQNTVWTAVILDELITTTITEVPLVLDADWSEATSQRKCTIIAVRGWLSLTPMVVAEADLFGYFGIHETGAASGLPSAIGTYLNEDIMMTLGRGSQNEAVNGFDASDRYEINLGSKRKLRTGQDLRLVFNTDVANAYHVGGVCRCLLKLNNG